MILPAVACEAAQFVDLAPMLGEQRCDEGREVQRAATLVGLGRAELDAGAGVALVAARLGDHLIDGQPAAVEIEIAPAEPVDFLGPHASGDGERIQRLMRAAFRRFEEPARFIGVDETDTISAGLPGALAFGGAEACAGGVTINGRLFEGGL